MSGSTIGFLLIGGGLVAHLFERMIVKAYGNKHGEGGMFFNAVLCLFASAYFLVTDTGGFQLPLDVFWYGAFNSVLYAVGYYFGYLALASGSFGLTRLCSSFSSIIPIFYGILWLGDTPTYFSVIGTVLIFASVFLMISRKEQAGPGTLLSVKWIISIVLMVLSNALIAIVSKSQQDAFGGAYKNEFLVVSFVGATLWLTVLGVIFERQNLRTILRHGLVYGMAAGVFSSINGLTNLTTYTYLPLSIISPLKTGMGQLLGFLVALFFYRERFSRRQWAGVIIGIAAVVLMNL